MHGSQNFMIPILEEWATFIKANAWLSGVIEREMRKYRKPKKYS